MIRIGKVFHKEIKDIGQCRIVEGDVRGKKIKNIVSSIDYLNEVTDKIGDRYNEALAHYPERNLEKGDCWGLYVQETDKLTHFIYSFVNQPGAVVETAKADDLDKVLAEPEESEEVIEVHPAEPVEVIPVVVEEKPAEKKVAKKAEKKAPAKKTEKTTEKKASAKKADKKAPKAPKAKAPAKAPAKKTEKKAEKAPKKSKYGQGVENFLKKQAVACESLMWTFNPERAEMVYGA